MNAVTVQTAAERLAVAKAGIASLTAEKNAARERMAAAQLQLEQLSKKRAALELAHDLRGEDVGASLAGIAAAELAAAAAITSSSWARRAASTPAWVAVRSMRGRGPATGAAMAKAIASAMSPACGPMVSRQPKTTSSTTSTVNASTTHWRSATTPTGASGR